MPLQATQPGDSFQLTSAEAAAESRVKPQLSPHTAPHLTSSASQKGFSDPMNCGAKYGLKAPHAWAARVSLQCDPSLCCR